MSRTLSTLCEWLLRTTPATGAQSVAQTRIAFGTEVGSVRGDNQDKVAALSFDCFGEPGVLLALSDGMGGLRDGEVCAALAIAGFFSSCIETRSKCVEDMLTDAAHASNQAVFDMYAGTGGATLSALMCLNGNLLGVNIGDSRIYRLRNGKLNQLSTDDTLAGQLGRVESSEESERALIQFVGSGPDFFSPHLLKIGAIEEGLLLTSDGAHYLPDSVISSAFKYGPNALTSVRRILAMAKWCGGHDNASVALVPHHFEVRPRSLSGAIHVWDSFGEFAILAPPADRSEAIVPVPATKSDPKAVDAESEPKVTRRVRGSRPATKKKSKRAQAVTDETPPELHVDLFEEGGK